MVVVGDQSFASTEYYQSKFCVKKFEALNPEPFITNLPIVCFFLLFAVVDKDVYSVELI